MQLERGSCVVALAALRAKEGFLPGVDPPVNFYVAFIDEPLAAVGAGVGFLLDMGFHVLVQLLFFTELNSTPAAEVELQFSCVCVGCCLRVCCDVVCL